MACFTFRGLHVEGTMSDSHPGDRTTAPAGGACDGYEFELVDVDEFCGHLAEHFGAAVEHCLRGMVVQRGELPEAVHRWISNAWGADLRAAVEEHHVAS